MLSFIWQSKGQARERSNYSQTEKRRNNKQWTEGVHLSAKCC